MNYLVLNYTHAYDFSIDALLEVLLCCFQNRRQRIKINTTFSSWTQFLQGVPLIYVTLHMKQPRTFAIQT